MNLFVGGTCLEDLANLQHSEAVRRLVGAVRLPDPTTAGDFLRRFDRRRNPTALAGLRGATDDAQCDVWRVLRRRRSGPSTAVVDLDAHVKVLYGVQKQGADFNHKGQWCYEPLVATMAGTGEWLAVRNRPGGGRASDEAAGLLAELLPRLRPHFDVVLVRGDSDFDRQDVRAVCKQHGAFIAIVGREWTGRPALAQAIPDDAFSPFRTRAHRAREEHRRAPGSRRRRRRANLRRRSARRHGYRDLQLVEQHVAEVPYAQPGIEAPYRLIVRKQRIEHHRGQQHLFGEHRYRYVVTDLPGSLDEVVDTTYERCDQENVIAQLGAGLAAWRMPVGESDGNSAWLEIARLAWNLAKWIAQLALPAETVRWECKRFRQAFVYIAAQVLQRSRQRAIRISASHRYHRLVERALERLQR